MRAVGLVLAGGPARRMGGDKALEPLGGETMIEKPLAILRSDLSAVAINPPAGDEERYRAFGAPLVVDDPAFSGRGPLAGVLAGLLWARAHDESAVLVTAPCDAPSLPKGYAAQLLDAARLCDAPVVIAKAAREHFLCALWRPGVVDALSDALANAPHGLAVRAFLAACGYACATFPDERAFANLNAREDVQAWRTTQQTDSE